MILTALALFAALPAAQPADYYRTRVRAYNPGRYRATRQTMSNRAAARAAEARARERRKLLRDERANPR